MGRGGDWKMRTGGDGEMERISISPFFLLPSPFFLLTNSRARHPRVQGLLQVGNWEQRVQAKQEEWPDLPPSC